MLRLVPLEIAALLTMQSIRFRSISLRLHHFCGNMWWMSIFSSS